MKPQEPLGANAMDYEDVQREWHEQSSRLVADVEAWARELGWSTRRIEKPLVDSLFGEYRATGLIMQEDFARLCLEPIARDVVGADGAFELYLMPAYDDVAKLFLEDGKWQVYYTPPGGDPLSTPRRADAQQLSKQTLKSMLDGMLKHASSQAT